MTSETAETSANKHQVTAAERGWYFVDLIEAQVARDLNVIPVQIDGRNVTVAVTNPDDMELSTRLRPMMSPHTMRLVYADPEAIRRRIERHYSASDEARRVAAQRSTVRTLRASEGGDLGRVVSSAEGDNTRLMRLTIEQALRDGASDIHIEPVENRVEIRYRIDGDLRVVGQYPSARGEGLVTLVKVQGQMRTDNHLVPDSGVIIFDRPGRKAVDIRVETAPTAWGQSAVMRLQSEIWRPLDSVGFSPENLRRFKLAIDQPDGLVLLTGPTGSGKMLELSVTVPTPSGSTTMGELEVGDEVLGRDGRPSRVIGLSPINETPDLYRVTFSDGQQILADHDHQWLVATHHGRNVPRTQKRLRAIARYEAVCRDVARLELLADLWDGREEVTLTELVGMLNSEQLSTEMPTSSSVWSALHAVACPRRHGNRAETQTLTTTRPQRMDLYRVRPILSHLAGSGSRRAEKAARILDEPTIPTEAPLRQISGWFGARPWLAAEAAARMGVTGRSVVIDQTYTVTRDASVAVDLYPTAVAFKSLALRLRQRFADAPAAAAGLTRMTTGEMIAAGLRLTQGHANFAVPVTAALDLPQAALPLDPYIFGAWLGDGATGAGTLTSGAVESCTNADGSTDQNRLIATLADAGYSATVGGDGKTVRVTGLRAALRRTGAFTRKHIPTTYLRASAAQRLAVLQGLMDTDGTVDATGCCELSLSDKTLATDALELIRSLGIKASVSWDQPASYRDETGELVVCKDRHRIHFTTDQQVFRLPRKAARLLDPATGLPRALRETATWLYITDIEKLDRDDPGYGPARCITVDSPDHTYLCGDGFVVTSNTTTLYAALNSKIDPTLKIITLENPIEYKAPEGISQMAMRPEQGMTFPSGLRSILRQDPDVVLLGEVRDRETAETVIDAAMTGHLVLSTLHTNSAPGAIPRLSRMGIEPLLVADSLLSVVGQRLIKRLCERCKVAVAPDVDDLEANGFEYETLPEVMYLPSPTGCNGCRNTGWAGRVPIHEVMLVDEELGEAIAADAPQAEVLRLAAANNMTTMRQDGFEKAVYGGLTTVAEINGATRRKLT